MEDDGTKVVEEKGKNLGDSNPYISVYAISGISSKGYRTIRVTLYVKKKTLHILIDSNNILYTQFLGCWNGQEVGM